MSSSAYIYELGTTEEVSKEWSFLEANATWRFSALDGVRLLLYREDYESVSDAQESGGVYAVYCANGEALVASLEAVRSTCFALGHYLCVALKTQLPVSFE